MTLDTNNVSFSITQRSPISENAGSYVYSISIPYTNHNAAVFGFPFRLQRKDKTRATAAGKIEYNGKTIQYGIWQAKTTSSKTISLEMLIDAGVFASSIAGKNLPELFDIAISEPDIVAHLESQVLKTYPEVNHNFPVIYNPAFYGDPKETDPDKNPNLQFEGFLNNYKNGFVQNGSLNRNTISPQLYLVYILKHIFETDGHHLQGTPLTDEMLLRATIYNNVALDKLQATTFSGDFSGSTSSPDFPVIWNTNLNDPGSLYNTSTGEYLAKVAGDYQLKIPVTYTRNENYDFVMTVEYNGVAISTKLIYKKIGDNSEDNFEIDLPYTIAEADAGANLVVKAWFTDGTTNYGVNIDASISIVNTTQPMANILTGDFNYKNMVPDMAVKDFLKAVYFGFGILPFFNEKTKTVTLLFWRELLLSKTKSEILKDGLHRYSLKVTANNYEGISSNFNFQGPDDFSNDGKENTYSKGTVMRFLDFPSVTIGDIYLIESLNAYYQIIYDQDSASVEYKAVGDSNPETVKDEGKLPMDFALAPMLMRCPRNVNYAYRNLPSISAQGTSLGYNISNSFPLRIMFWIGITDPNPGAGTDTYPLATTTKFDTAGNVVLPISWKTDEILGRYYPEYLAWLKRREGVEFTNEITGADMAMLDFMATHYFQYAQIILEEAYIKLRHNQLGPAKMKGWTV